MALALTEKAKAPLVKGTSIPLEETKALVPLSKKSRLR
jgi:hypothetical protein